MSEKIKKLIKDISEVIIADVYDFDNDSPYEYERDRDFGCHTASIYRNVTYKYGNATCEIEVNIEWPYREKDKIEIYIYGGDSIHGEIKYLKNIQSEVEKYLRSELDLFDLLKTIEEDIRDSEYDEWNDHGFADEADYFRWRYS